MSAHGATVAEDSPPDPIAAHAEVELGFDPEDLTTRGRPHCRRRCRRRRRALPLIAILSAPVALRIPITVAAVLLPW